MSYVVKCDRCGDTARTPVPFGEAPNGWLALAEVQPHGQVTSDARGYHFCAGCVASFDRWMNDL